jgi:hypothetical protein
MGRLGTFLALAAIIFMATATAQATVVIQTVPVGNAGNAGAPY